VLVAAGGFDTMQVRYNLMFQHPSDWHNNQSIILMRPLTSGIFQRMMAEVFPEIDTVS
jgi:hypothetical protein